MDRKLIVSSMDTLKTGKFMDILYDILNILISIADITTDIIVLKSFCRDGRYVFFVLSLIIICLTQIAYSAAFIWKYDVLYSIYDRFNSAILGTIVLAIVFFFILIPMGPLIPIIIFLTEDEESYFTKKFEQITGSFYHYNSYKSYK